MDISEQVKKVLKDMETRERKVQTDLKMVEGSMLADLTARYNAYVGKRQWEEAHECLLNISRLVASMLS